MQRIFFYLHLAGLGLIGTGLYLLLFTTYTSDVKGMLITSCALGLGAVMISPYPVVKFIEWSQSQADNTSSHD